ncbi:MAG TPA: TlpA disulfide reductase family protein [Actinomycetota bacterium]|jgi:cytochrome c biogenesis protein CcmG/thiol:disulfide interchange protein DsbE
MKTTMAEGVEHGPAGPPVEAPKGPVRRRRWVAAAIVGLTIALLASLLSFGLSRDPTVLRSQLIGRPAPSFTLRTLDGSRIIRLSELRGQVVVLNFFASWCRDCRVEHPALGAAWSRFRDQGAVFLGVSFQDRKQDSAAFGRELQTDWPLLEDSGSRTALAYGVYGIPETFFIGKDGRVAYKQIGAVPYEVLSEEITRLLQAGS